MAQMTFGPLAAIHGLVSEEAPRRAMPDYPVKRAQELRRLADYYKGQGDMETAAEYLSEALSLEQPEAMR